MNLANPPSSPQTPSRTPPPPGINPSQTPYLSQSQTNSSQLQSNSDTLFQPFPQTRIERSLFLSQLSNLRNNPYNYNPRYREKDSDKGFVLDGTDEINIRGLLDVNYKELKNKLKSSVSESGIYDIASAYGINFKVKDHKHESKKDVHRTIDLDESGSDVIIKSNRDEGNLKCTLPQHVNKQKSKTLNNLINKSKPKSSPTTPKTSLSKSLFLPLKPSSSATKAAGMADGADGFQTDVGKFLDDVNDKFKHNHTSHYSSLNTTKKSERGRRKDKSTARPKSIPLPSLTIATSDDMSVTRYNSSSPKSKSKGKHKHQISRSRSRSISPPKYNQSLDLKFLLNSVYKNNNDNKGGEGFSDNPLFKLFLADSHRNNPDTKRKVKVKKRKQRKVVERVLEERLHVNMKKLPVKLSVYVLSFLPSEGLFDVIFDSFYTQLTQVPKSLLVKGRIGDWVGGLIASNGFTEHWTTSVDGFRKGRKDALEAKSSFPQIQILGDIDKPNKNKNFIENNDFLNTQHCNMVAMLLELVVEEMNVVLYEENVYFEALKKKEEEDRRVAENKVRELLALGDVLQPLKTLRTSPKKDGDHADIDNAEDGEGEVKGRKITKYENITKIDIFNEIVRDEMLCLDGFKARSEAFLRLFSATGVVVKDDVKDKVVEKDAEKKEGEVKNEAGTEIMKLKDLITSEIHYVQDRILRSQALNALLDYIPSSSHENPSEGARAQQLLTLISANETIATTKKRSVEPGFLDNAAEKALDNLWRLEERTVLNLLSSQDAAGDGDSGNGYDVEMKRRGMELLKIVDVKLKDVKKAYNDYLKFSKTDDSQGKLKLEFGLLLRLFNNKEDEDVRVMHAVFLLRLLERKVNDNNNSSNDDDRHTLIKSIFKEIINTGKTRNNGHDDSFVNTSTILRLLDPIKPYHDMDMEVNASTRTTLRSQKFLTSINTQSKSDYLNSVATQSNKSALLAFLFTSNDILRIEHKRLQPSNLTLTQNAAMTRPDAPADKVGKVKPFIVDLNDIRDFGLSLPPREIGNSNNYDEEKEKDIDPLQDILENLQNLLTTFSNSADVAKPGLRSSMLLSSMKHEMEPLQGILNIKSVEKEGFDTEGLCGDLMFGNESGGRSGSGSRSVDAVGVLIDKWQNCKPGSLGKLGRQGLVASKPMIRALYRKNIHAVVDIVDTGDAKDVVAIDETLKLAALDTEAAADKTATKEIQSPSARSSISKRTFLSGLFSTASEAGTEDEAIDPNDTKDEFRIVETLEELLGTEAGTKLFVDHCAKEYSEENMEFFTLINTFKVTDNDDTLKTEVDHIFKEYIKPGCNMQVNVPNTMVIEIKALIGKDELSRNMFDEAQQEIFNMMSRDSFSRYKKERIEETAVAKAKAEEEEKIAEKARNSSIFGSMFGKKKRKASVKETADSDTRSQIESESEAEGHGRTSMSESGRESQNESEIERTSSGLNSGRNSSGEGGERAKKKNSGFFSKLKKAKARATDGIDSSSNIDDASEIESGQGSRDHSEIERVSSSGINSGLNSGVSSGNNSSSNLGDSSSRSPKNGSPKGSKKGSTSFFGKLKKAKDRMISGDSGAEESSDRESNSNSVSVSESGSFDNGASMSPQLSPKSKKKSTSMFGRLRKTKKSSIRVDAAGPVASVAEEDDEEDEEDKVVETLGELLGTAAGVQAFVDHSAKEFSMENMDYYLLVKKFKVTVNDETLKAEVDHIFKEYINPGSDMQVNVPNTMVSAIKALIDKNELSRSMFDEAQQEIFNMMSRDSFSRYKKKKQDEASEDGASESGVSDSGTDRSRSSSLDYSNVNSPQLSPKASKKSTSWFGGLKQAKNRIMDTASLAEEDDEGGVNVKIVETLEELLGTEAGTKAFTEHCAKEFSSENMMFHNLINSYRSDEGKTVMEDEANSIFLEYIKPGSMNQVNVPNSMVKDIEKLIKESDFSRLMFDEAQQEIFNMMSRDSFSRYKKERIAEAAAEESAFESGSRRPSGDSATMAMGSPKGGKRSTSIFGRLKNAKNRLLDTASDSVVEEDSEDEDDENKVVETLEELLATEEGIKAFVDHCAKEFSDENMLYWKLINTFKISTNDATLKEEVDHIFKEYVKPGCNMQVNVPNTMVIEIKALIDKNELSRSMFDESQQEIFNMMSRDSFSRYKKERIEEAEAAEAAEIESEKQSGFLGRFKKSANNKKRRSTIKVVKSSAKDEEKSASSSLDALNKMAAAKTEEKVSAVVDKVTAALVDDLLTSFVLVSEKVEIVLPPLSCLHVLGAGTAINQFCLALSLTSKILRNSIRKLNLSGCSFITEDSFCLLIKSLPNLRALSADGLQNVGLRSCRAIGRSKHLKYLDLSNTNLDDECVSALCQRLKWSDKIRKFSIANANKMTDKGLKCIGSTIAKSLTDLCVAGCYRITDAGIMALSYPKLKRLNYSGAFRVLDEGGRRHLLSVNPQLLIYNKVAEFGVNVNVTSVKEGEVKEEEEEEEEVSDSEVGLERVDNIKEFRRKIEWGY